MQDHPPDYDVGVESLTAFVGGVIYSSFLPGNYVGLTWPFIELTISGSRMDLRFRSGWARGLAQFASLGTATESGGLDWWATPLDEITGILMLDSGDLEKTRQGHCPRVL